MENTALGVIFDMDGVLVNSEYAMRSAAIESLERYGIHPVQKDFVDFTGMGEDRFIGGVAEKYGLAYREEMKDYAYALYVKRAKERVYVFPQTLQTLKAVRAAGCRVAVASAADAVKVRANLACVGVEADFFDALVTGSEVSRKKPDPEVFLKAAEKISVPPARCLVVEDALSGIAAAKAAGMSSAGVTTSFDVETLRLKAAPDYIVPDIGGIANVVVAWKDSFFAAVR